MTKKRKPPPNLNNGSQGDRVLLQDVETDFAALKVSDRALRAGNRKSKEATEFLMNEHLDSGNAQTLKCKKTLREVSKPGFTGADLTPKIVDNLVPELQPFNRWCKHSGTEVDYFVQVYLGVLREANSQKKSGMDHHRDKKKEFVKGREPDLRLMYSRIAESDPESIEKVLSFRRLIQGTANRFDKVSFQILDGRIVLLGPYASGKTSSIQHQPSIYKCKNSVSWICDIYFPDGSPMKQWTVPEISAYFKKLGIFEDEPSLNVRLG